MRPNLTILGGGISGISAAYYAHQKKYPFDLYEAESRLGGNCSTTSRDGFSWDSGAHRLHDKDPEITGDLTALLGRKLLEITAPSKIYYRNKTISFPIHPVDLLKQLGIRDFSRAFSAFLSGRISRQNGTRHFKSFANAKYGTYIAERFLLNYSEKLWGIPADQLSPSLAGKRLSGMSFINVITESLFNRQFVTEHVEGRFLYPRAGIGTICQKMAQEAGIGHIHLNCRVTRIVHQQNRISEIVINGNQTIPVSQCLSTIPLPVLFKALHPEPPPHLTALLRHFRYRHIVLVILTIDRPQITPYATLYFPDRNIPFTRIYEPKNRSGDMSPANRTQLIAEIPCFKTDKVWTEPELNTIKDVQKILEEKGLITKEEIIDAASQKLAYCYPILSLNSEAALRKIHNYLSNFSNLNISGRSGRFVYAWIHDMIRHSKELVNGV